MGWLTNIEGDTNIMGSPKRKNSGMLLKGSFMMAP